jgi:hypothetical protein
VATPGGRQFTASVDVRKNTEICAQKSTTVCCYAPFFAI